MPRAAPPSGGPTSSPSASPRPAAFAALQVADFGLQAVLRIAPELASQPVGLLTDDRPRATLCALTPAARAQGVTLGLTAPQAQARCSQVLIRPPQPAAEADAHATLLAVGFSLSPLIEATSPGVITADVAALAVDQREPLLRTALEQLQALGLSATGGLGATPLLALYAARAAHLDGSQSHGPGASGTYRIVTEARDFLAPLPLALAEPDPELTTILTSWGLHTLGDLTALAKAEVAQRLGPPGLALWERAAGECSRPLRAVRPPPRFAAHLELEHPVETLEPLLFLLRRFVDRLTLELSTAGRVAATLELTLLLEDESTHQRSFRLPEPTADADVLFRTLQSHLDTLHTDSAVVAVGLTVEPTRPLTRQHGLFDTGLRDPHGFAETLARTVAVVGSGRVGTPRGEDTHRPDAVTLEPPAAIVPPAAPPDVLPALGLPLRRFRPPRPARVELHPTGPAPAYVWTEHLHAAVTAAHGPWRGSGDWWQPDRRWEREEWDVALAEGGLYRVVRTPTGWWLEGEYD
jgi:protein ImuB